jgi:hypothetical protein
LAGLVRAALQGENPTCDESTHNVISREISIPLEILDIPDNPVGLIVVILWIGLPVGSGRYAGDIGRKVIRSVGPEFLT